jgi:meiosis-specific protein HOP1
MREPSSTVFARVANTGNSVNVHIASVTSHLPSKDDDNALFAGVCTTHPALSPGQEHASRQAQTTLQMNDADNRNVVWDAEAEVGDEDAEGEDDDDYVRREDGSGFDFKAKVLGVGNDSRIPSVLPLGIRNEAGEIEPLPSGEVEISGVPEEVPTRVGEMVSVGSE